MTNTEYRTAVIRTEANRGVTEREKIMAHGLGLAGEAGEVADLIKKHIAHGVPMDVDKLKKELGDVRWYLEAVAYKYGLTMDDIEQTNVDKLKVRYPNGFTTEDSITRRDEHQGTHI